MIRGVGGQVKLSRAGSQNGPLASHGLFFPAFLSWETTSSNAQASVQLPATPHPTYPSRLSRRLLRACPDGTAAPFISPRTITLKGMYSLRAAGVIPARLASTRLNRKVLREIHGRPMVEWVWRAAADSGVMDTVVVATDAAEVAEVCKSREIPVVMTSPDCASGSDRVREVARQLEADIYVNIQGDEPTLTADFFPPLLAPFSRPEVAVTTLAVTCPAEDIANPNAVKVVSALDGRALYFSRATIPFDRDQVGFSAYRKHLGIYAYRKAALETFASLPPGRLEIVEKLEQLRLLENGIGIYVATAPGDTIGVDTEEDLVRAETILRARTAPASRPER